MDRSEIYVIIISKADSGGGGGGRASPIFLKSVVFFFFCNHFEELQTALFEVELIINNVRSTYVYRNSIETCLTIIASVMIFWIGGT